MYAKLDEKGSIVYPPHNSETLMNCHLDLVWLAENGYADHPAAWFAEHAAPAPVKRYSTLKLHDAVGHEAWQKIVSSLSEVQQTRLALAQELASDDAQFAAAIAALRTAFPNADEILAAAEVL